MSRHALVVGGTGMLRGVSLQLARSGWQVSVNARPGHRLMALTKEVAGYISALPADWHVPGALERELAQAQEARGPFDLAVVWMHSDVPAGVQRVAHSIWPQATPCRFFHVRGSAALAPQRAGTAIDLGEVPQIAYHDIILGFVLTAGGSRWLTHDEIVAGILAAMDGTLPRTIVGTVEPWSARP